MPAKKTSNPKTSKSKKQMKQKEEVKPIIETPVEATPVVEDTVGQSLAVEEVSDQYNFEEITARLREAGSLIKELTSQVATLQRRVIRDRKVMDRKMKGRVKRVVDPNKPPSGFAKPGPVSDELRKFLSLGSDELIARTEVTKRITIYCKENNLQKPEDKRTINVDPPLRKLLRIDKGEELTFFNLQKYMKVHYPNKDGIFIHN